MPTEVGVDKTMLLLACATAFIAGVVTMKIFNPSTVTPKIEQTKTEAKEERDPILDEDLSGSDDEYTDEESDDDQERHKMILAVRTDLKMSSGKIAAQCGHATLGV
jgi:PTH2 family peptidyl-tRNA hydrolase